MVARTHIEGGLLALISVLSLGAFHASDARSISVPLDEAAGVVYLGSSMDINDQVLASDLETSLNELSAPWAPNTERALQLKSGAHSIWVRVDIQNTSGRDASWVLDIGSALADHVDVYLARDELKPALIAQLGDRLPFSHRALDAAVANAEVHLATDERATLILNSRAQDGFHEVLTPALFTPSDFVKKTQWTALLMGCIYGALLISALYSLVAYARVRQPLFIWFGLYSFTQLLYNFIKKGYAYQYVFTQWPELLNRALPAVSAVGYMTCGLFICTALDTKHNLPAWLHRLFIGSMCLLVIPAILGLSDFYHLAWLALVPVSLLIAGLAIGLAIRMAYQGSRPARFYLLAFAGLIAGVVVSNLQQLELIDASEVTENVVLIGTCIQYVLLSIGVADQIAMLHEGRLNAEMHARQFQEALTKELDERVKERTHELELANDKLRELSITDEMTKAFNRRYFNQQLSTALNMHARNGQAIALCLLDIDHFKRFNDLYGHPAGDEVLKSVAGCIRAHLNRRGEHLFRVGGEEFAMLITTESDPFRVSAFVSRIACAIQAQTIVHEGSAHGVITASFGIAWLGAGCPTTQAQVIYSKADAAMYRSKNKGRNKVTLVNAA